MPPSLKDTLRFTGGMAIIAHQTLLAPQAQWPLISAALAMMLGAPALERLMDRWRNGNGNGRKGSGG